MKDKCFLLLLLVILLLSGCSRLNRLPQSTGQPYEVVLVGDTNDVVANILQENVEGLPQAEPMCQLIKVRKGQEKGLFSLIRLRVVVDVDKRNKDCRVTRRQNVNAEPQLVLRIQAQTPQQLRQKLDGEGLRNLIDSFEIKHLASMIKPNGEKQDEVKKLFGLDMKIPVDMDAAKHGKDFLWYSNNANTGMQSLLMFRTTDDVQIDSILRKNMLGETDDMYMVLPQKTKRGLWEMKGDAMGGPFVMRRKGNVVVIGFVYAPEMKKKKLIKQLEAVLTTIK